MVKRLYGNKTRRGFFDRKHKGVGGGEKKKKIDKRSKTSSKESKTDLDSECHVTDSGFQELL